ncbi:hypothetical protein Pint_04151 [Pistacia integerrima]|uniref:Uncharacterized protein n=1 Tax=Pistacia integerrima TaxID=434235 RepID=A0ACC0Z635_9ROSI|nr:hypothetical protein Pint_04151 [Pistacia integerrima]
MIKAQVVHLKGVHYLPRIVDVLMSRGVEWNGMIMDMKESPITEISEVCSGPTKKKVSSKARLWRSGPNNGENYKIITVEGMKGRLSNGRLSNGSIASPDWASGKGGLRPPDLTGQWSSPDSGNPHITRGIKGCIEWPRGSQKTSLKAKLLEARIESQKLQLRQEPYLPRVEAAREVPEARVRE